ncbi:uncharacterized protein LOC110845934 isoform X2 [Folsomia candida]|uniref:uncharacterized protein LOC110845934 isoform X2 n=1 Tax=Folsomia candida TaxID=158441 RepID=UPI000B900B71|nr:uncharacterized protein LOC110845934 isoform X2 [Folsomia candida]
MGDSEEISLVPSSPIPNKGQSRPCRSSHKITSSVFVLVLVVMVNNHLAASIPAPSQTEEKNFGAAGNIGCLFGKTLCDPGSEICYDDYAFGRCLPQIGAVTENDLYRYDLSKGDMHVLQKQMERLFALGYRWGSPYTQCLLQNLLDTIRYGVELDESVCLVVQDQDLEGALRAFNKDVDPWNLAFIKFSPSAKNPHSDFADETYRPPKDLSYPNMGDAVNGRELLTEHSPGMQRLHEKIRQPVIQLPASDQNPLLVEQELENTVAQIKGKNGKGKGKSGKNKKKPKGKLEAAKRSSMLNVEYPGQSDNFNGVDIGSAKKIPGSRIAEEEWEGPESKGSVINNKLKIDGEVGVDSDGFVNDKILRPKIFSAYYNTPDSFRLGVEESWNDHPVSGAGRAGMDDEAVGVGYGPGYGNDDDGDGDYRARREELSERQAEEDQQIGKAVATLQAQLLLSLLKDNTSPENEFRADEPEQSFVGDPATNNDRVGVESMGLDNNYQHNNDAVSPFAADLDDRDLLYTEGGLVFLNQPHRKFLDQDAPVPQNEGLTFLKRFTPVEIDPEWGALPSEQTEDGLITPLRNDIEYGNEYVDGYDFGSPFFLLNRRNRDGFGFERRERLDVKKPGPWYRTVNNYAFDKDDSEQTMLNPEMQQITLNPEFGSAAEGPADMAEPTKDDEIPRKVPLESVLEWQNEQQVNKKSAPVKFDSVFPASLSLGDGHFDIIDTSYANVFLDKSVNWNTAKNLVDSLAYALDMDRTSFKDITTNNDIVTFKVEPNDKGWNATEVARRIQNLAGSIEAELGLRILKTDVGIRANSKTPAVLALYDEQDPTSNQIYVATFAVCGLVAAVLVAAVAIFLVRKHSKSREKLVRLSQDDPSFEACKDYQDLCRARMAGSKTNEKMEPIRGPAHKIASKDSENGTNSSRSSTSSWSEEPVMTNMDISTGHMVLEYMEDHLKNKDRLDKEWAALCAYEADPCTTAVAEKAENSKKNRYSNSLPFDHSRVVLSANDLANVCGSDYINASTITDHDPRNPAYIATQGPLPNTAADFWQMVWEQGSVVIVNLTRLTENTTALCHRYWPEEGSELHHIYECFLVSEHIWCDEYLVRSFYLKNLKTGETRTVTQFHFLAWPENGIPQSTKALLEFRRKVNKSYRGRSCPIIVHCSDGAGRSGTYCLIDMVLNRMTKGAKEIDIAASLEHIRDQRPGMVRTRQQFEFVLMAVAEEVHAILKQCLSK